MVIIMALQCAAEVISMCYVWDVFCWDDFDALLVMCEDYQLIYCASRYFEGHFKRFCNLNIICNRHSVNVWVLFSMQLPQSSIHFGHLSAKLFMPLKWNFYLSFHPAFHCRIEQFIVDRGHQRDKISDFAQVTGDGDLIVQSRSRERPPV